MAVKIEDLMKGMTAQLAQQAGVPTVRIERDPIYMALIGKIVILERAVQKQAEQLGALAVAVTNLEDKK